MIDGLIVPGMVAIGIAFDDPSRRPTLSLSVAGIADRLPRSRWPETVAALHRARESIDKVVRADLRHAGTHRPGLRRIRG